MHRLAHDMADAVEPDRATEEMVGVMTTDEVPFLDVFPGCDPSSRHRLGSSPFPHAPMIPPSYQNSSVCCGPLSGRFVSGLSHGVKPNGPVNG